ncbi:methyltransferase-like protein 22 isoform X2 [Prionailurus bengalensis]|uniref:methyltransferase-like protein 22 isoform X2 n=1 Tax=Prionailurus bengalensis TaxID=37029 RepID=UPI001CA9178B|nr:methyltransferase-like protein 22 isoform X2 [Prionailurus bengalensis]
MDEVTFKSDTVLSDVHLYTPNHRHLMVRLNGMGQPVFLSQFKLLWNRDSRTDSGAEGDGHGALLAEETPPSGPGSARPPPGSGHSDATSQLGLGTRLDEDGDLDVERRPPTASDPEPAGPLRDKVHPTILTQEEEDPLADGARESSPRDIVRIGVAGRPAPGRLHPLSAGPLPGPHRAGARGGHGAGQHHRSHRGTHGVLYSCPLHRGEHVCAALSHSPQAGLLEADVGADLLAMCQRNIALNGHLTAAGGGVVKVKELDWLRDDLCTDPEVPFSWSQEDVSDLYSHTTILLAAEVFYDDDLTDALFKTLSRLAHKLQNACTAILSVEKRLNFTLRHLDVTCEAYDHFRSWLRRLEGLADGRLRFAVERVEASFPQLLVYERIQQLVGAGCHCRARRRGPRAPTRGCRTPVLPGHPEGPPCLHVGLRAVCRPGLTGRSFPAGSSCCGGSGPSTGGGWGAGSPPGGTWWGSRCRSAGVLSAGGHTFAMDMGWPPRLGRLV